MDESHQLTKSLGEAGPCPPVQCEGASEPQCPRLSCHAEPTVLLLRRRPSCSQPEARASVLLDASLSLRPPAHPSTVACGRVPTT